jgi:hypothetical protein
MRDCDILCAECAAKGRSTRCSWVSKLQEAMLVLLRDGGAASRCDAFDVIAFNFGALSMCGASGTEMWRLCSAGGSKGRGALAGGSDQSGSLEAAREFVKNVCASETWLGQWQSHLYDPSKERVAGAGVLHGASALGAPSGGFRRGRSNLTAALDIALGCRDSSDVYILSDGAVDDSVVLNLTQFTCFTGTKVQMLMLTKKAVPHVLERLRFRFTGTKVQILTQKAVQHVLERLRALRHQHKEAVSIHAVAFGTSQAGHDFLVYEALSY